MTDRESGQSNKFDGGEERSRKSHSPHHEGLGQPMIRPRLRTL
jgi:hypothetical protein